MDEITLKKIRLKDIQDIYMIFSDKGVIKHQNRKPMQTKWEALCFYFENRRKCYCIFLKQKVKIGIIQILAKSIGNKELQINFIVKKEYRNKRYIRDALALFINKYQKIYQINVKVNANNIAAIHVLEAMGFKKKRRIENAICKIDTNEVEAEIQYYLKRKECINENI